MLSPDRAITYKVCNVMHVKAISYIWLITAILVHSLCICEPWKSVWQLHAHHLAAQPSQSANLPQAKPMHKMQVLYTLPVTFAGAAAFYNRRSPCTRCKCCTHCQSHSQEQQLSTAGEAHVQDASAVHIANCIYRGSSFLQQAEPMYKMQVLYTLLIAFTGAAGTTSIGRKLDPKKQADDACRMQTIAYSCTRVAVSSA